MRHRLHDSVDLGVLVDIISNVAGMMILLACISLLTQDQRTEPARPVERVKPISFPLAYLPDKRSVTLCLVHGALYELPEIQLLDAVLARTAKGESVEWLELEHEGVVGRIEVTNTATGYRFLYRTLPGKGLPLADVRGVTRKLDDLVSRYPPDRFFLVFHSWPEEFAPFRDVREYLHAKGVEVGWNPRREPPAVSSRVRGDHFDVAYSIGEYDERLTSIKAQ